MNFNINYFVAKNYWIFEYISIDIEYSSISGMQMRNIHLLNFYNNTKEKKNDIKKYFLE